MDEFEKTIRETLSDVHKSDSTKAEALRKEVVRMLQKKLKKSLIIAWLGVATGCTLEAIGLGGLILTMFLADSIRPMIFFGVITLSGGQFHLLAKLWYWVYHGEIKVRQEIKQLQLQIAELTGDSQQEKN